MVVKIKLTKEITLSNEDVLEYTKEELDPVYEYIIDADERTFLWERDRCLEIIRSKGSDYRRAAITLYVLGVENVILEGCCSICFSNDKLTKCSKCEDMICSSKCGTKHRYVYHK